MPESPGLRGKPLIMKTNIKDCLRAVLWAALIVFACPLPGHAAEEPAKEEQYNQGAQTGGNCAPSTLCYLSPFFTTSVNSPYGVSRPGHKHNGIDLPYANHSELPLQGGQTQGGQEGKCTVILNTNGSPLWEWGAAGLVLRQNCGNNVEIRYFHLHQYQAERQLAISNNTGRSTGPHLHYEVYLDNQSVDPECVLGLTKTDSRSKPCPAGVGPGPANLCDGNVRQALKSGSQKSTGNGIPGGQSCSTPADQVKGTYGNPEQLPKYDPPTDGIEGPYPDVQPSTKGTGITIGTEPGKVGEAGGEIIPGADFPPPDVPPLDPGTGGEVTSCAIDTMVAMTNQSVLEARRETVMQRRFISKADSVLNYGCLPIYLDQTQTTTAGIFSETDQWVNRQVDIIDKVHTMNKTLGAQSMDSSLTNVIWAAHESYKKNFNHPLMGGAEGYGEQSNPAACLDMQKVWNAAKCQNFPDPSIAFPRFSDLISSDPRQFPSNMACNSTGINQGMIDAAKNKATRFDKVKPRLDYLSADKDCQKPVSTGLTIYRHELADGQTVSTTKTYEDAVCSNAGCSYDNSSLSGMGTCVKN